MRSHLMLLALGLVVLGSSAALPDSPARKDADRATPAMSTAGLLEASIAAPARAAVDSPAAAAATATAATDARALRVESALDALASGVAETSAPDALRLAFQAYFNYKAEHPDAVRNPYLYFVDYGLDNRTPRGYVFDMASLKIVDGPFTVAHGRGSSSGRAGVPTRFSDRPGSAATSLGLFLTQETYSFSGHSGGRLYHSIGLRLKGLDDRFNGSARDRGVVVHGAPYVTAHDAGRSEGCPAMEQARARRLIPKIANGGLVFLFSPRDSSWLRNGAWMQDDAQVASAK